MMQSDRDRLLAAILRQDFASFLRQVFLTLLLGQPFVPGWHIDAIAHSLGQVASGDTRRLVINMPPRSLKSIAASVALPAFILGHNPTRRIICVSYSSELAHNFSNSFRVILSSEWYRRLFPGTRIGLYKDTENEIELTARGGRLATSVGGTLTGRGGDLIIIDDPLKPIDAMSEPKREFVNQWFASTLLSRLDNKRTGTIVIVMQRVHMYDLTGFVLGQSEPWSHLSLPAIAEHDQIVQTGDGRFYQRIIGEPLSPVLEPLDVLRQLQRQLGSDLFSAQYQQSPVPPGGAMIKRNWLQTYHELPSSDRRLSIVQSWDTAAKGGPDNDWSVCTTWMRTRDQQWYLLDVWRRRVDYPSLKVKVVELANLWSPTQVLVEESGTAIGLIQELRYDVSGITPIRPDKDKITRMSQVSAIFEAGQVHFPSRAAWLPELEAELFAFPGSRHDDQVDSISQALLHGRSGLLIWEKLAG